VVRTYADEGKRGLRLDGRDALKHLIEDVQDGKADFTTILVYDVSRWGRFQDADESAYYEYICRRAGIAVQYCAEQFENDGSPVSTIVKGVKRAMAGEYIRELSAKVFAGQCRLIEIGYPQHVFTVFIQGSDRPKFGTPEITLMGKRVCATGVIKDYRGKPEIIATEPRQLAGE
jgi:DNA invertase Pin-like site-specific DNA recombinase